MSQYNKEWRADVIDDPARTQVPGSKLNFVSSYVTCDSKAKANFLRDPEKLGGILLIVSFENSTEHYCEGSAVMVGPGIALCAAHVIQPYADAIVNGSLVCSATSVSAEGMQIWALRHATMVSNSDLAILTFKLASEIPGSRQFRIATISTRLPALGEELSIVGFRASHSVMIEDGGISTSGNVITSKGIVTQQFKDYRDTIQLKWPCLELDCPSWGGMSGGPVFDSKGLLIGLLSTSFDLEDYTGPSFISLLWPALMSEFIWAWPDINEKPNQTLIGLNRKGCFIDRPEVLNRVKTEEGLELIHYKDWS